MQRKVMKRNAHVDLVIAAEARLREKWSGADQSMIAALVTTFDAEQFRAWFAMRFASKRIEGM